jgi:hypothetical protein
VTEVTAPESWRVRFHVGQRVWVGCKDAVVEEIRDDRMVFRRTRRAGFTRFFYNTGEVESLVARDLLREYVKPERRRG